MKEAHVLAVAPTHKSLVSVPAFLNRFDSVLGEADGISATRFEVHRVLLISRYGAAGNGPDKPLHTTVLLGLEVGFGLVFHCDCNFFPGSLEESPS